MKLKLLQRLRSAPRSKSLPVKTGAEVVLRLPIAADRGEFLSRMKQSKALHRSWVTAPQSANEFAIYLRRCRSTNYVGLLLCTRSGNEISGVINISEIVRGGFQSAYLGYYMFHPFAGRGLMREGLTLAVAYGFQQLGLHRLEANIQPGNEKSKRLVQTCGFHQEGFSPRYLKIGGRWRDHERWAILSDQGP